MYVPKQFEELRVEVMHGLIRSYPLATLVTLSSAGLNADHIPLHLSEAPAPYGSLRGHIARANPLWQDISEGCAVLAFFRGPDAYISLSWYASKKEHGKVVPTWNYVAVHANGTMSFKTEASWIRAELDALTDLAEAPFAERWRVAEAPHEFTEKLIEAVVGIEIVITKLEGKWKVSQNQPPENQAGVIEGLKTSGARDGAAMAALIAAAQKPGIRK